MADLPGSASAEDIATAIDQHCKERGWDWRAELAAAGGCCWQATLTVILTPDRQDGPDRSLSTFAGGGVEPADVFARAWDDMRAWLAELDGDDR